MSKGGAPLAPWAVLLALLLLGCSLCLDVTARPHGRGDDANATFIPPGDRLNRTEGPRSGMPPYNPGNHTDRGNHTHLHNHTGFFNYTGPRNHTGGEGRGEGWGGRDGGRGLLERGPDHGPHGGNGTHPGNETGGPRSGMPPYNPGNHTDRGNHTHLRNHTGLFNYTGPRNHTGLFNYTGPRNHTGGEGRGEGWGGRDGGRGLLERGPDHGPHGGNGTHPGNETGGPRSGMPPYNPGNHTDRGNHTHLRNHTGFFNYTGPRNHTGLSNYTGPRNHTGGEGRGEGWGGRDGGRGLLERGPDHGPHGGNGTQPPGNHSGAHNKTYSPGNGYRSNHTFNGTFPPCGNATGGNHGGGWHAFRRMLGFGRSGGGHGGCNGTLPFPPFNGTEGGRRHNKTGGW